MNSQNLSNAFAGAVVASFLLGGVLIGLLVWSRMRLLARRALLVSGPLQLFRPLSTFSPSDKSKPNTYDDLREHDILRMMGMIKMRIGSFVQTCFSHKLVLTPNIRQDLAQHLQVVEGRLPDHQLLKLLDLNGWAFLRHFIVTAAFDAISMKTSAHTSILQQETLAFLQAAERERETDDVTYSSVVADIRHLSGFLWPDLRGSSEGLARFRYRFEPIAPLAQADRDTYDRCLEDLYQAVLDFGLSLLRNRISVIAEWTPTERDIEQDLVVTSPRLQLVVDWNGLVMGRPEEISKLEVSRTRLSV